MLSRGIQQARRGHDESARTSGYSTGYGSPGAMRGSVDTFGVDMQELGSVLQDEAVQEMSQFPNRMIADPRSAAMAQRRYSACYLLDVDARLPGERWTYFTFISLGMSCIMGWLTFLLPLEYLPLVYPSSTFFVMLPLVFFVVHAICTVLSVKFGHSLPHRLTCVSWARNLDYVPGVFECGATRHRTGESSRYGAPGQRPNHAGCYCFSDWGGYLTI